MKKYTLGEICIIIKGSTGIKKAIAGDYPLVVTAEERLSSNEYQFDAKAVCIPLVSSTGHGHASLKRIHYQEGKFALGNILAAVIPNDEKQLNAEYLYYYLSFYKDSKIVPLMKGAANVSLTINSIKTIIIEFPDIDTQYKIVETIKNANKSHNAINKKYVEQDLLIKNLKESILLDAVKGKLVPQDPTAEPAPELLKRIKSEKEQLIKDGKIKKEKPLPPIAEGEMPYELPQGWEWVRLDDLSSVNGGYAFKSQNYLKSGVRVIRISDFDEDGFKRDKIVYYEENKKYDNFVIDNHDILLAMTGGTVGKSYYVCNLNQKMYVNQRVADIKINKIVNSTYINFLVLSPLTQDKINECKNSTNDNISMLDIRSFCVPLPPLKEQQRIVAKVNELMQLCDELENKNNILRKSSSELLQSIMQNVFCKKESLRGEIIDLKLKRAILSAEIISQLHNEQYFGAIKLEKILYLCETHLNINLGGNYKQEVAGPHDAQSRYEIEDILKNKKWFDVNKEQKGNIQVTKYTPLEKSNEITDIFSKVFSVETIDINNLVELFKGKNTDFCESIATLYAVWLNRLGKNLSCSDSDLISDFKAWSKQKARFYDSDLQDRILFMRRKNLTPDSNIKK